MPADIQVCIDYNFIDDSGLLKAKELVNNEIITEMKKLRKFFLVYLVCFLSIPTILLIAAVALCVSILWSKFNADCCDEAFQFIKYYFVFN